MKENSFEYHLISHNCNMGWFKRIFGKKTLEELKPLKVQPVSFASRLGVAKKKKYLGKFALMYNGKPIREFQATDEAYSRDQAAKRLNDGMSVKLLSVVQEKPRKDDQKK
jgi:hypothetical protein